MPAKPKLHCDKHNLPRIPSSRLRGGKPSVEYHCKKCVADRRKALKKETSNAYARKYRNSLKGRVSLKKAIIKRLYGITLEQRQKMFEKQNGCCAICNKPDSQSHNGLHTDHIDLPNGSKLVRGLLCSSCNNALGLLQENHELALRAASYIALKGLV